MHRYTVFHDGKTLVHLNIRDRIYFRELVAAHREMTTRRGICLI